MQTTVKSCEGFEPILKTKLGVACSTNLGAPDSHGYFTMTCTATGPSGSEFSIENLSSPGVHTNFKIPSSGIIIWSGQVACGVGAMPNQKFKISSGNYSSEVESCTMPKASAASGSAVDFPKHVVCSSNPSGSLTYMTCLAMGRPGDKVHLLSLGAIQESSDMEIPDSGVLVWQGPLTCPHSSWSVQIGDDSTSGVLDGCQSLSQVRQGFSRNYHFAEGVSCTTINGSHQSNMSCILTGRPGQEYSVKTPDGSTGRMVLSNLGVVAWSGPVNCSSGSQTWVFKSPEGVEMSVQSCKGFAP